VTETPPAATLRALLAPALAAGAGLAVLVAHPPVGWWWTTFLAPALLLAALSSDAAAATAEGRGVRAARLGALAGVVAFAPMLSWLILPAGVVGWGLLVLTQTAWMAVLAAAAAARLTSAWLPLVTAVAWTGIDAWRAVVPLNGFEWGALKFAHVDGSWLLPTARLVGGRGITFLTVLIGAAAFVVVRSAWRDVREREDRSFEQALRGSNRRSRCWWGRCWSPCWRRSSRRRRPARPSTSWSSRATTSATGRRRPRRHTAGDHHQPARPDARRDRA
jgi:apolipoprotein N-acyltransferase